MNQLRLAGISRERIGRSTLWAAVLVIALLQVVALYVLLPGRVSPTFTAVQPDSVQYICYGLKLSGKDYSQSNDAAEQVFVQFGYQQQSCFSPDGELDIAWQVYSRLVLPVAIAAFAYAPSPYLVLVPSILFYGLFIFLWGRLTIPREKLPGLADWLIAAGPLLAFSMVLWIAAVLTEGPYLALSLLAVLGLIPRSRSPKLRVSIGLILIGALMLSTRQSWPVVGALWFSSALMYLANMRPTYSIVGKTIQAITRGGIALGAVASAWLANRLLETLTVPSHVKASQAYTPEGLEGDLSVLAGVVVSGLTSTFLDVQVAISRGELMSPLVLAAGLVFMIIVARRRHWPLSVFLITSWLLGLYAVGLVAYYFDAYGTHFRYLAPAALASIAAGAATGGIFQSGSRLGTWCQSRHLLRHSSQ